MSSSPLAGIANSVQATESSVKDSKTLARHVNSAATVMRQVVTLIERLPLLLGRVCTNQHLVSGVTSYIAHGLGRQYRGYIVTRSNAAAVLVEQTLPAGKTSDKFIGLQSASSGTFDILVF